MKNIDLISMIDEGFEDFEKERNKRKNIKLMLDFNSSEISHIGKKMSMNTKPVYKQKFEMKFYIKNKKNDNSLF